MLGSTTIHRTHQEQSQEESLGKTTLLPLVGLCGEEMRESADAKVTISLLRHKLL